MKNNLIKYIYLLSLIIIFLSCNSNTIQNENIDFINKDSFSVNVPSNNKDSNINIHWATTDISIGKNRIAFALTEESEGFLKDYEVIVSSFYLSNNKNSLIHEIVRASYYDWPHSRGIYVANMDFDKSGSWGITISVSNTQITGELTTALTVNDESKTPSLNSKALMSINKVNISEDNLSNITSDLNPDPELYSLTISEAIKSEKPLLVVFASPGYCITKTCGPQVDILKELKDKYKNEMNFIHIDVYDNLDQIKGNLEQARISQVVLDWGLPSEPWSFLINSKGIIVGKFEGFISEEELSQNIQLVIR